MNPHLLETLEGGIATLTMHRPEARNALSAEVANTCCDLAHQHRYACIYGPNLHAHADLTWLNPVPSSGLN